ncbi:MAG: GerW family sporulation protein [Lachnospiraceae bacterium]|nr:GerW family sporulation protein [Lachnospiraceae bacterium]
MSENNFTGAIESLTKGLEGFLSTKTVVGEPTQVGDTIIIPLVDVSFGIGAGSSISDQSKRSGAGGGLSGKMSPNAVLIIHNGQTKLVTIKNHDSLSKIIDMVPELVDKFTGPKEDIPVSDEEAVDVAFPESDSVL